jgi:hypothetical protein
MLIFAIWVALGAAPADIGNASIAVLLFHFSLLVAVVACIGGCARRMACGATAISSFVIYWECVPADINVTPIAGIVAFRALPAEVA